MTLTQGIKKLSTALIASAMLISLSACASQNPGASIEDGFSLLNAANDGQQSQRHGKTGKHGKHGGHQMMIGMLMKDLNLSDSQKTQFKTLMQDGKADHQALREQMKGFKEKLKTQFLSDSFDSATLKAELAQVSKPNASEMSTKMATKLVAAWQILTPAQQSQLETKLSQMEARFAQWQDKKPASDRQGKHLEQLKTKLGLSDAQIQELGVLKASNSPDRAAKMAEMRQIKTQVLAQLKAEASTEQIALTLAPMGEKMGHGFEKQLEKMQAFHAVLTPTQRQQMVEMMQQRHQGHRQHKK